MFDIQTQLYEGQDIRFGPIDHEKDAEIESKWTHDSDFMRMMDTVPARPMSAALVKKQYEKLEKQMEDRKNEYYFTIRAREDDRLIGKAIVQWIEWANGNGYLRLGIGAAEDRGKGYGTQALRMLLRIGFVEEVRRRQSVERDARRWNLLVFGLLQEEWLSRSNGQAQQVEQQS